MIAATIAKTAELMALLMQTPCGCVAMASPIKCWPSKGPEKHHPTMAAS
jgi:hypothetical protein